MEAIVEDIKQLEKDAEKIQCNPIIIFVKDFLKCMGDSLLYLFRYKT
jgi:type IV secretory pathway TrbF-like protein